ncbi:zinc ABC transporter permease AztB [Microbacterium imperiale]|uniref:ABC transporter permease n=1 Tax=Microbacterium imperiale TaxID=33884 RepID=A0A9W6HIY9_9MICO|nr:zinc ABC transporter permease AztB [Microbacterium imperiale]MBP2421655.1 ABC-type Mn2+/Zn2+ transport system permease subunit [Microbacterium imperiale]MDS0199242.1 metal ABC transporter permease [Microbacterium imperiale]BFE41997.1 zinc ABC transporter permease AztB [Microbacterium imperiale]GLJ80950.1 ABC transporter permease [Microbacterium imperiale]
MSLLLDPFSVAFVQRALLGGALVAIVCGIVGTWVVLRGMAFLGEAMAHGMLPGVAVATLTGFPPMVGAALSAAVMSVGVGALQRRGRLSADTSIGLLFVASLSLGVIVISASRSFATDASAILFGEILAIGTGDLAALAVALLVTVVVATLGHRSFVALTVDPRQAQLLGLRPRAAHFVLVGLVTLAVVSAYQAVGSLLVVGMLLGPAVAAGRWTRRIVPTMALAAVIGTLSVAVGLLLSWHLATAAGATVAFTAICSGALSTGLHALVFAVRRRVAPVSVIPNTPERTA